MDLCSGAAEPEPRLYVGGIIMGGECGGEPQEEEEACWGTDSFSHAQRGEPNWVLSQRAWSSQTLINPPYDLKSFKLNVLLQH